MNNCIFFRQIMMKMSPKKTAVTLIKWQLFFVNFRIPIL